MSAKEYAKRYCVFLCGVLILAMGAVFMVKSGLGATPLTSVPYCLSLILPRLSYGAWVIVFNLLMLALEIIVLRGKVPLCEVLVQAAMTFCFGRFVDMFMRVFSFMVANSYGVRLLFLLLSCVTMAFGLYLEIIANVAMLPADAFDRALTKVTNKPYSFWKIVCDFILIFTSAGLCLAVLGTLTSVREGSVAAALMTGLLVKWLTPLLAPLKRALRL